MNSIWFDMGAALWFGILTSISPCPLATNIAAISYVGRKVGHTRSVLFSGLLYTLGRSFAYMAIALVATRSMQMIPGISHFLQKYMNIATGPLLFIVGILLLDLFRFNFGGGAMNTTLQQRIDKMGTWGAGLLGIVFALTLCPVSAGLFFGGLIPLALKGHSLLMSTLFGIGTALPVMGFALLLAFAVNWVGTAFNKLTVIEIWVRRITAATMIIVGMYLVLKNNIGLDFGF